MVAQQLLVLFVKVRVLAGLPLNFSFENKFSIVLFLRLIQDKLTKVCLTTLHHRDEYRGEQCVDGNPDPKGGFHVF